MEKEKKPNEVTKYIMENYGVTIDESLSEEAIDKALRPALMMVGEDKDVIPVRSQKLSKRRI